MSVPRFRLSSVTRWLLVVAGCVVLETTQPAFAAADDSPDPAETQEVSDESIIYPRGPGSREAETPGRPASDGFGWLTSVLALSMAGAGVWLLWRKKQNAVPRAGGRKIQIEETRPMGNRQYLIVARCEGRRFLLGVTPGRIDVVSPLDPAEDGE